MTRRMLRGALLLAASLLLGEGMAHAGCTITVNSITFGTYDVFSPNPLDTTGTVVYQCDRPDKGIRITFTTGSSGTYGQRTLRQGADVLGYNLYIGNLNTIWGDGREGTSFYSIHNPPNNRPVTITVFGRIRPGRTFGLVPTTTPSRCRSISDRKPPRSEVHRHDQPVLVLR